MKLFGEKTALSQPKEKVAWVRTEDFDVGNGKKIQSGDKMTVLIPRGKAEVTLVGLKKDSNEPIVQTADGKFHLIRNSTMFDIADSNPPQESVSTPILAK